MNDDFGRPPNRADDLDATTRSASSPDATTRSSGGPAPTTRPGSSSAATTRPHGAPPPTTRAGNGIDATTRPGGASQSAVNLPAFLSSEYEPERDLFGGNEASITVIRHRDSGERRVVKIYRPDIPLSDALSERLANVNPAYVLPVERFLCHDFDPPRFIELMDYVPGGSLQDLLDQSVGRGRPEMGMGLLTQLANALDYVHTQLGIVHRDVKPANILVRSLDPLDVVLADLGLAAEQDALRRTGLRSEGVKGTLIYQAPETLDTNNAEPGRDWWALGMMMFEIMTGEHPFKDGQGNLIKDKGKVSQAITMGRIDLSSLADPRWNLLCRGLLTHQPEHRWGIEQIRRWTAGESPTVAEFVAKPAASEHHVVRRISFAGKSFTDPRALAEEMKVNWQAAAKLFQDEDDCRGLRDWIKDDVQDNTVAANLLSYVSDAGKVDRRIIAFTSHYLGGTNPVFRGEPATAASLATRFLGKAGNWRSDPVLAALGSENAAALAEAQYDADRGRDGQHSDYYALLAYSRYVGEAQRLVETTFGAIERSLGERVEGTDIGANIRPGLAAARGATQARVRAALLDTGNANQARSALPDQPGTSLDWQASIHRDATRADGSSPTRTILSVIYRDTAAIANEQVDAIRRAGEAAEAERKRQEAAARQQQLEQERAAFQEGVRTRATSMRSDDWGFAVLCGGALVTFLVPWLIGRFGLTHIAFKHSSAIYDQGVIGDGDYVFAHYLGGAGVVLLVLAAYLARPLTWSGQLPRSRWNRTETVGSASGPNWSGRTLSLGFAVAAVVASIVAFSNSGSQFDAAEAGNIKELATTSYPFTSKYKTCGTPITVTVKESETGPDTEVWQLYLTASQDFEGDGCNRVVLYRGWQEVSSYTTVTGVTFDSEPGGVWSTLGADSYSDNRSIWGGWDLSNVRLSARAADGAVVSTNLASPDLQLQ